MIAAMASIPAKLAHSFVGAIDGLTRPPLLGIFAIVSAGIMWTAGLMYVVSFQGVLHPGGEHGVGDYLAFHTGAEIVATGQGDRLYDFELQYQVQSGLVGHALERWQPFVNPPAVALALSFIAKAGPDTSFRIWQAVMALALVFSLVAIRTSLPTISGHSFWITVLLVSSYPPLLRTVVGGQNTVLTLALLVGLYAASTSGRWLLGGLLLGALTYKPQYVPLLGVFLLVRGQFRIVAVGAVVGLGHYVAAAVLCGWDWPWAMLQAMAVYRPIEWAENVQTHFALIPFFDYVWSSPWNKVLVVPLGLAVWGCVLWGARRVTAGDPRLPALWGLAICGAMLTSPHLQYYDAGITAFPVLLGLETLLLRGRPPGRWMRLAIAVWFLAYPAYWYAQTLGFQPLTLGLAGIFLMLSCMLRRQEPA